MKSRKANQLFLESDLFTNYYTGNISLMTTNVWDTMMFSVLYAHKSQLYFQSSLYITQIPCSTVPQHQSVSTINITSLHSEDAIILKKLRKYQYKYISYVEKPKNFIMGKC